jgi:hypothetical protein
MDNICPECGLVDLNDGMQNVQQCSCCGKWICEDCYSKCHECYECGEIICSDCEEQCEYCNEAVCHSCIDMHYCGEKEEEEKVSKRDETLQWMPHAQASMTNKRPSEKQIEEIETIRFHYKRVASKLEKMLANNIYTNEAIKQLEDSLMWAVKSLIFMEGEPDEI